MFRLLPFIALLFSINTFSQTIKVRPAGNGKVRFSNGKVQSIVNLSKDIAGCLMAYDSSDPKRKRFDVTSFELLDSVKKGSSIYVVLLASAQGNCNVQGQCGAAESHTLFWLKLNSPLRVQDKRVVVVEECLDDINLSENSSLKFNKGLLSIEIEDNLYRNNLDYTVTKLIYKHSAPEKGFSVKIEKRARPKN